MKNLLLGLMMAFAVTAEAGIVKNYTLNESLTATLDDRGALTIIGFGVMPDWQSFSEQVWADERSQIKSVVGEGEVTIGRSAFEGCGNLSSVSLPNATGVVGCYAFCGCSSLASVSLPSATTIGEYAFQYCVSLNSVLLPSATTIGERAFEHCVSLTEISLPNATMIGDAAFFDCSALPSVSLPSATTIGANAFKECRLLNSVSLPSASTIGEHAFMDCNALSVLVVNTKVEYAIEENRREYYGLTSDTTIIYYSGLPYLVVKNAEYEVKEAVVEVKITPSSVTLKSGGEKIDESAYATACQCYGITPLTKPETPFTPTSGDLKVVSKDTQVIGRDEIAVKKESIAAPSAGTVKVEDGKVQLGVSVLKTSDLTAEKKDWGKVKLTKEDIDVDADGNIIVNVPVDSQSGFMVIQTKDAKVGD